jgi:hypothetical protein
VDSAARIWANIFYVAYIIYIHTYILKSPPFTPFQHLYVQLEAYTCLAAVPDVSRNVAVLKVGCPLKTSGRESG